MIILKKWRAISVLVIGLILSFGATNIIKNSIQNEIELDFEFICNEIKVKIDSRLKAHAQLLRSGASLFAATDTVTLEEWKSFNESEKIDKNLPGILGVGFSLIVPKNRLLNHIESIRNNGFPDYAIYPAGDRDFYTSIIYLVPFSARNQRAFGYDMYTEPVRRKAMEFSRDSNYAMLSGKVHLVQEITDNIQAGTLMYVPVYKNGMKFNTLQERRASIIGWVYSPYRMNDLMSGIIGNWDLPNKNRIHLKIYDDDIISEKNLLFDSQNKNENVKIIKPNLFQTIPVEFNSKKWTLQFTGYNERSSLFHGRILIVLLSGIVISILLFSLSLALINVQFREEKILQLNHVLEKLNDDKDQFISILAHDLKSPFNALLGYSDLLLKNIRTYDLDKVEAQIQIISDSTKKIYRLLEDILNWAKTQSGKIPFEPEKINFSKICSEVIENLMLNASNKNIKINCLSSSELYIYADYDMLRTILHNLVSNGIKFTNIGGQINISIEQNSSEVTIIVSDNGTGIEPEIKNQLFDLKNLYSSAGTADEKGSGFGLLICKEFVEKHGGKIWVDSKMGEGSDFKFSLPKH
jgi:signal transduction histidine kinase